MALIVGTVKAQFFNTNGTFCSGGLVYSYVAGGGTTNKATYPTVADALAATNANSNPVVLDSRGEANIVLQGSTRLVLKTSTGTQIWSVDNLNSTTSNVVDSNGNGLLSFVEVASAVNGVTITNATTTNKPSIAFTGGDTNIGGIIATKGTATLSLTSTTTALTGNATVAGNATITGNNNVTGNEVITGNSSITGTLSVTGTVNFLPPGSVTWYAGASVPTGWLECDGSAVSRTTYAALFAAISTTWGTGDGSTTFNLPSQARRVVVGRGGSSSGTLGSTLGSTGGAESVVLTGANMPVSVPINTNGTGSATVQSGANYNVPANNTTGYSTGSATATSIMQPSMVMIMIIRSV